MHATRDAKVPDASRRPSTLVLPLILALSALAGESLAAGAGPGPPERADWITVSATAPKLTSLTGQFKTTITATGHADSWYQVDLKLVDMVNVNAWIYLCPTPTGNDFNFVIEMLGGLTNPLVNGSATLKATLSWKFDHQLMQVAEATVPLQIHGLADAFAIVITQAELQVWYSPDWKQPSTYVFHAKAVVTKNLAWADLPAGSCEALIGGLANAPPYATGQEFTSAAIGDAPLTVEVTIDGKFYWAMTSSLLYGCAIDRRPGAKVDLVHKVVAELPLGFAP